MKFLLLSCLFVFSSAVLRAEDENKGEQKGEMKAALESACTADAATAGCGTLKVGSGMMKCIHAYKKEHKDFKVSEGCKAEAKKMRAYRQEHRQEKHQEHQKEMK